MVFALNAWIILSAACMGLATAALLHAATRYYSLNLPLKLVLVGLAAASPLAEIGMELGNVSVVASALCVLSVASPDNLNLWIRAAAVVVALLLKPHIALWIVIACLFTFTIRERALVWRLGVLITGFSVLFTAWGIVHHSLWTQFSGYRAIVLSELSSGSMSPGNCDVIPL